MENLTPQQALANLSNASALAKLSFEEHLALQQSVKILNEIINPKVEEKKQD